MTVGARDYWEHRYGEAADAHADQNRRISEDFLAAVEARRGAIFSVLRGTRSAVEVGCGTGEFLALLHRHFGFDRSVGLDLSAAAVAEASRAYGGTGVEFVQQDATLPTALEGFDLALSSNTLEHFRYPWKVLNGMLAMARRAIVLVPYDQPCVDGYDHEGGAGHVFRFTEGSFSNYRVLDWFRFRSSGWQHSSSGEEPRQMAALVEAP